MTFEWTAADEAGLSGLEPAYTSGIPGSVSWVCVRLRAALAELRRRDAMRAPKLPIARWEAPAGSATPEGYVFAATPPTPAPAAIADMVENQRPLAPDERRAIGDVMELAITEPTPAPVAGPPSARDAECGCGHPYVGHGYRGGPCSYPFCECRDFAHATQPAAPAAGLCSRKHSVSGAPCIYSEGHAQEHEYPAPSPAAGPTDAMRLDWLREAIDEAAFRELLGAKR